MGWPSYLCSVLFARAPVLGLYFFVSVTPQALSDPTPAVRARGAAALSHVTPQALSAVGVCVCVTC